MLLSTGNQKRQHHIVEDDGVIYCGDGSATRRTSHQGCMLQEIMQKSCDVASHSLNRSYGYCGESPYAPFRNRLEHKKICPVRLKCRMNLCRMKLYAPTPEIV